MRKKNIKKILFLYHTYHYLKASLVYFFQPFLILISSLSGRESYLFNDYIPVCFFFCLDINNVLYNQISP